MFIRSTSRLHRPIAALLVVFACVSDHHAMAAGAADSVGLSRAGGLPAPTEAPPDYRVARGDELSFRFFYVPELNTVATVRSDGQLALPLIGDMAIEGLTIAELGALVQERLSEQVRRPQVVINVQGVSARRVFVGGEVARPGVQPLSGPLSVVQAVMVAEGLRDTAQGRKVIVLRRGAHGEAQVLPVDLDAALSGRDPSQDITLQAYDVVVVPRSGIADVNLWVDQYIKKVLPFGIGLSYSINRNGVAQ